MAWQMLLYEPYLDPQPCRQAPSSRLRRQDVEACGDVMPLYNIGIWCYPTIYITLGDKGSSWHSDQEQHFARPSQLRSLEF